MKLQNSSSFATRAAPWIEGLLLAIVVLIVVSLGGDSARVSYHGLLHSTIGEAVLRDGLLPENPYHAGADLNYYTLYPTIGVLLGRLGGGALWGFAIINIFAALLMGPALDSFGKSLKLSWQARRFSFLFTVLGFNAFGYWLSLGVELPALGSMPMAVLEPTTNLFNLVSWDARLQSFLPKFLNVSSFACALPFMLFAAASELKCKRLRCALLLGVCVAINPLVGGFATMLVVINSMVVSEDRLTNLLSWVKYGLLSGAIAIPFVLPLLFADKGDSIHQQPLPFEGDGALANIIAPNMLLILIASIAWFKLQRQMRQTLLIGIGLAIIFSFANLPFGNEYKFPRLLALFLAIAAGFSFSEIKSLSRRVLALLSVVVLSTPTTFMSINAYSAWDVESALSIKIGADGKFVPRNNPSGLPLEILSAFSSIDSNAIVLMNPRHPGAGSMGLGSQGNQWAPLLKRSLFVDKPQIHNRAHSANVSSRLNMSSAIWSGKYWPANSESQSYEPRLALEDARQEVSGRPLVILSLESHRPSHELFEQHRDSSLVARQDGVCLWEFSAASSADEN